MCYNLSIQPLRHCWRKTKRGRKRTNNEDLTHFVKRLVIVLLANAHAIYSWLILETELAACLNVPSTWFNDRYHDRNIGVFGNGSVGGERKKAKAPPNNLGIETTPIVRTAFGVCSINSSEECAKISNRFLDLEVSTVTGPQNCGLDSKQVRRWSYLLGCLALIGNSTPYLSTESLANQAKANCLPKPSETAECPPKLMHISLIYLETNSSPAAKFLH